jgi:hypothetical protein
MSIKVKSNNEELKVNSELEKARSKGLKWLKDNFGKHKAKRELTRELREKIACEMTPKEEKRIAKKYGFI